MLKKTFVIGFALLTMGAGPCDFFDMGDEEEDGDGDGGSEECYSSEATCTDALIVEVIRSDNMEFMSGAYEFDVLLPDETQLFVECYLAYTETGVECTAGNVDVLYAQLEEGGRIMWMFLLGAPEATMITVIYNGLAIGQRSFTPAYEELFPNGPECEPMCHEAKETMAVESW
ncbi:MAG: hypothetical protein GY854_29655 [Deltaproteobacteria bacterium]|nr:hypothetical protein [Deltaproteobacteria bacterium]